MPTPRRLQEFRAAALPKQSRRSKLLQAHTKQAKSNTQQAPWLLVQTASGHEGDSPRTALQVRKLRRRGNSRARGSNL